MEKMILFGAGDFGRKTLVFLRNKGIEPLCFVDNNLTFEGSKIDGVIVYNPKKIKELDYKAIVVCVSDLYEESVYDQLRKELNVRDDEIIHWTYWKRLEFLNYYTDKYELLDDEERQVVDRILKDRKLRPFNYDFIDEYRNRSYCVFDEDHDLFYVDYYGRRLYLSSRFKSKDQADGYICSLLMEQDNRSPHRYLSDDFSFNGGCVLDAGAAEGNFSLSIADKAEKIILVEADSTWNKALRLTFSRWKDKVIIINKHLGEYDDDQTISLKTLAAEYHISFIKMDIEGAEVESLRGGIDYLKDTLDLRLAVCSYHNIDDERRIREILEPIGYTCTATKGYMVFPDNLSQLPRLVKGVIRIKR